jgi:hypothetical protein
MTDIVERLLSWIAYDKNGGYPNIRQDCLKDIHDSAMEIKRLREECEKLEDELAHICSIGDDV